MPSDEVRYAEIDRYKGYRFGSDGSVWTRKGVGNDRKMGIFSSEWRRLHLRKGSSGHLNVWLGLGKRDKYQVALVHRLILEAFVGPCPDGLIACHNNGIPGDNRIENLRWDTHKSNTYDRVSHGTNLKGPIGEKHGNAKLTLNQVNQMFELFREGMKQKKIAEIMGIHQCTVSRILGKKRWGRVLEVR